MKKPRPIDQHCLDLERAHFEATFGPIRVTGTWYFNEDEGWTPCLALTDARKHPKTCIPCIIQLQNAWIWAFHGDVGDPIEVFKTITIFLKTSDLPGEVAMARDYMQIVNAVNARLPDLIAMPPFPPGLERDVIGVFTIKNETTGEVIEQEVSNDV